MAFLLFVPQILLITLYDLVYFTNDYVSFSANCWWAFSFLHATLLTELISIYLLRHMKQMPFTKKHPMWLFTIEFGIQYLFAVVFSLVRIIKLKWVIILSSVVFIIELFSLEVLLLIQKHREKISAEDGTETESEDIVDGDERELPSPPPKITSTAMLLLMKFLADPNNWDVPEEFNEINRLTELASSSTQYTYEKLLYIENDIKEQTNALKTYIQSESFQRAKSTVLTIIDLLERREKIIFDIEKSLNN